MELLLNTPELYHKEIIYLYGFVISVSNISLCVMVDRTLIIEFDYTKTISNIVMDKAGCILTYIKK